MPKMRMNEGERLIWAAAFANALGWRKASTLSATMHANEAVDGARALARDYSGRHIEVAPTLVPREAWSRLLEMVGPGETN